jgi:hypothetical protein
VSGSRRQEWRLSGSDPDLPPWVSFSWNLGSWNLTPENAAVCASLLPRIKDTGLQLGRYGW